MITLSILAALWGAIRLRAQRLAKRRGLAG